MSLCPKYILLATLISCSISQVALCEEIYVVDSSHTSVVFYASHFGFSHTYGRFNQAKGGFVLAEDNPTASQFQFTVNANSIDTNNKHRDKQLKGPDFLNVTQFDVISFQSSKVSLEVTKEGEIYNIEGTLTIRGVTRPVTIQAMKLGEGPGPKGGHRAGFTCKAEIKRSDFGMKESIPAFGDEVGIIVSFEGLRQEAPE